MLTRTEANQKGTNFAESWNPETHTVSQEGMQAFAQDLNSLNGLAAPQKNSLKWAELRGATDGLIARNILPNLDFADNKSNLRNCRIVGLTADGDKNSANDDLVVAIGRKSDNASKAENVVILGQDGKFYQALQVKGGYVRSQDAQNLIAQNAAELEQRYNRSVFTAKREDGQKPQEASRNTPPTDSNNLKDGGNPADLESFRNDLQYFQNHSPANEQTAQRELERLAEEYSKLSRDQKNIALQDVIENNQRAHEDVWLCGLRAGRPQVAIQRGPDGSIRFSAGWSDGTTFFRRPRSHQVFSQKYEGQ